jgi:hypothetical protein
LLEEIKDEREDDRLDDEPSQRHSSEVVLALTSDQGPVQESEESISVSSTTYVRLTVQS